MTYLEMIKKYKFDFTMSAVRDPATQSTSITVSVVTYKGMFSEKLTLYDEDDKLMACIDSACRVLSESIKRHQA